MGAASGAGRPTARSERSSSIYLCNLRLGGVGASTAINLIPIAASIADRLWVWRPSRLDPWRGWRVAASTLSRLVEL